MKIDKILTIILFAAFLLRIVQLESVPPGFYKDEAFIGYDDFSLLHTGKDFHGNPWPLYFEDSWDWRNPVYYYLTIPSIAIFGLTVFATRLAAVFFGTFSILALFLLARELFDEKKALLAAAFVAISPWSLQFSRIAFEATALPAFFLFALWLFLRGFRHPKNWIASFVFFALSLYTYITAIIFIPLFLISLFIIFKKELIVAKKQLILPIILFLILSLPLITTAIFSPNTFFARSGSVSVFSNPDYPLTKIYTNYLQYFSVDFLFENGDHNLRVSPPGYGKLLWFMSPLLIAGVYTSFSSLKNKKNRLLLAWLLLFPVAGFLTADAPYAHSTRSIVGIGLFELLAVTGAYFLFNLIKKFTNQNITIVASILFLLLASANTLLFLKDYFYKYPTQAAEPIWFESGLKEAFAFIKHNRSDYDYTVLTPSLDFAKIYAAFYLSSDSVQVQTNQEKIFQCEPVNCKLKGKLLLLRRADDPKKGLLLKVIKNRAGKDAFKIESLVIK